MCEIDIRRETENERLIHTAQYNVVLAAEHGQEKQVNRCLKAMTTHMFHSFWCIPIIERFCHLHSVLIALKAQ